MTVPLGELERSSHPLAEIGGCLLLRGNWAGCILLRGKGKGKREGRRWEGEMRKGGEGEKGKDDLHPTLFRPW